MSAAFQQVAGAFDWDAHNRSMAAALAQANAANDRAVKAHEQMQRLVTEARAPITAFIAQNTPSGSSS